MNLPALDRLEPVTLNLLTLYNLITFSPPMDLTPEIPTPKRLLKEAKAETPQHPYDLADYGDVIDVLFRKSFSYAKIAKWLSVRLGVPIKRGQIYYVYQNLLKSRQVAQSRAVLEQIAGEEMSGIGDEPETLDPEHEKFLRESHEAQLDAKADEEDAKRKRKRRKSP